MKISYEVKKFQVGGPAPMPDEAPMPQDPAAASMEANPVDELTQMAAEALQSGNCDVALAVCQGFIELMQEMAGGGAPQEAPAGQPVYRKGGILVKRV